MTPFSMTQTEICNLLPSFLCDSVTYSVVVTDLLGDYSYVNDLFKKRFAFLGVDFIGKPFQVAIHPGDVESAITIVHQCIANPNKVFPIDIRKPCNNDNEFHWTHWEFSLFKDATGNPAGILCVGHDITESQKIVKKLRHSENKLRAILESTNDANLLISPDYKIISFNKQAAIQTEAVFGKPLEVGATMKDFILPNDFDDFYADTKRALNGEYIHLERKIFFGDASAWLEVNYIPAYDPDSKLVGFTFSSTNITERKTDALKIVQQDERLKHITWQQSHELRRHVVNIMGLYNLIKLEDNLSAEEKLQHLDTLLSEVKELDITIHEIVSRSIS